VWLQSHFLLVSLGAPEAPSVLAKIAALTLAESNPRR
jgi:hypothetical protein